MIKAFMPVTKTADGKFVGILSDSSMDRDEEAMSKELLHSWSKNKSVKALANHTNKMESWVGGWRNLKTIGKGSETALVAEPWFFSKEANPLAAQIKKQVEEAIEKGENPGISIGAIPHKTSKKEIDGEYYKIYEEAELVEATWVPIQSNRNATFGHIAKRFDLNLTDEISKEETDTEVNKMTKEEEVIKETPQEEEKENVQEPQAKVKEEPMAEEPAKEEVKEEAKEEPEPKPEAVPEPEAKPVDEKLNELEEANKKIEALSLKVQELEDQAILKGTVEGPLTSDDVVNDSPLTIEKMLKIRFGGQ